MNADKLKALHDLCEPVTVEMRYIAELRDKQVDLHCATLPIQAYRVVPGYVGNNEKYRVKDESIVDINVEGPQEFVKIVGRDGYVEFAPISAVHLVKERAEIEVAYLCYIDTLNKAKVKLELALRQYLPEPLQVEKDPLKGDEV